MKAVIISIRPRWCELIASGKKTIEVRKTRPKLETPFKCYIYMTKSHNGVLEEAAEGNFIEKKYAMAGKVIGEFVCDVVYRREYDIHDFDTITLEELSEFSCVSEDELLKYGDLRSLYGWHISDLVIYDKPKELSEFVGLRETRFGYAPVKITRPPQSWCYVEVSE